MRVRSLAGLLTAGALLLACDRAVGPAEATESLRLHADPVEIAPAELHGLRLVEALELSADHEKFGGFSGLLVEDGRLTAVTDAGWLLTADLAGLRDGTAAFRPLPGNLGAGSKSVSDAESLARVGERLAIGFERDHRIELLDGGRPAGEVRDRRFEAMSSNAGLEALATLPGGDLLAIGEAPVRGGFPVFIVRTDGRILSGTLPQVERHAVTGADVGPDGLLYLLRRDWSLIAGVSIRIERYRLDEQGAPRPETREVLAAFENASGIDNMEGIATWREPDGAIRLAIISDDNFNLMQRTLLLVLETSD